MDLPFTVEQFFDVFQRYNEAVWPMQFVTYGLAVAILILLFRKDRFSRKAINGILSFLWIFMGVGYHLLYFSEINAAAFIFGGLFIVQGLLFFWLGVVRDRLSYRFNWDIYHLLGSLMVVYAMIGYPLLGNAFGHLYPEKPMFGVAPCPTVIFTFGILLMSKPRIPWGVLVIPGIWSLIGFSAAWQLSVVEDYGLFVSGVLVIGLVFFRRRFDKKEMAGISV